MADSTPKSYHTDPTLYLYTSLTAGSSHIITATSRLETILKANKVPFLALDVATDEKARMLWGRRAGKRKLPGLVRMGMIVGDLEEVEEWNEYGELKEHVAPGATAPDVATPSLAPSTPSKAPPSIETPTKIRFTSETPTKASQSAATGSPLTLAMRQAGLEAAKKASDAKSQARTKVLGGSETSNDAAKKLENSTAPGIPPPSGTTDASPAITPETDSTTAESKVDDVETTKSLKEPAQKLESAGEGESNPDKVSQNDSHGLHEVKNYSENEKGAETQSASDDRDLSSKSNNPEIAVAREVSSKETPDVGGQDLVTVDGEKTKGSNPR